MTELIGYKIFKKEKVGIFIIPVFNGDNFSINLYDLKNVVKFSIIEKTIKPNLYSYPIFLKRPSTIFNKKEFCFLPTIHMKSNVDGRYQYIKDLISEHKLSLCSLVKFLRSKFGDYYIDFDLIPYRFLNTEFNINEGEYLELSIREKIFPIDILGLFNLRYDWGKYDKNYNIYSLQRLLLVSWLRKYRFSDKTNFSHLPSYSSIFTNFKKFNISDFYNYLDKCSKHYHVY